MNDPAIIIIAYNRAESLKRLLTSIAAAEYPEDRSIPLVISIDKGDNADVIDAADSFIWEHGEKTVIKRAENMGLKAHVLECSKLTSEYGSSIILEDDLFVSKDFYKYSAAALEFTRNDDRIAGISLYNHLLNVHAREPFEALRDESDNWYFQFASSWGQAYTAAQWEAFESWMQKNDNTAFPDTVPENVRTWDNGSWLKYYIRYVVETDKYFLYPNVSRTTNFTSGGTHRSGQEADFQVPLINKGSMGYRFRSLDESESIYDAYFENVCLKAKYAGERDGVTVDLYGKKPVPGKGFLLSSKALPYKIIRSYGRCLRPIDANILNDIPGDAFRLYDLSCPEKIRKTNAVDKLQYNYRAFKAKYGLQIIVERLKGR